ncbi:MAG: S9 family peptidase [bacterium]|nr:S9 family peptidase [bacterium]
MKQNKTYAICLILVCCALALSVTSCSKGRKEKGSQLILREALFAPPTRLSPKLSPDGKKVAYLAPLEGVMNVWVKTIGQTKEDWVTQDRMRGIHDFFWVGDGSQIVYVQDAKANNNWRLWGVRLNDRYKTQYTPYDSIQAQVITQDNNYPDELLITMNQENRQRSEAYYLNLPDNTTKLIAKNPGTIFGWVADARYQIRGAMSAVKEGGFDLLIRNSEGAPWKRLLTWDADNSMTSGPIGFSKDGSQIFLTDSRDLNGSRVVKLHLSIGVQTIIAEDSQYSVSNVMVNPVSYEVVGVAFNREKPQWEFVDPSIKEDFDQIRQLQNGTFYIVSRDAADQTWLVGFTVDNGPVSYYAYNRSTKSGVHLFDSDSDLKDYPLMQMEPITISARDGLELHGYLTYPPGGAKKNLPLVLNVHGGPWERDNWGYNPEAQWLASRGYACLQINYRGSTGYGKKFLDAGDREWGGKMQDDLIDAVNWAIKEDIADPKRIAIFGQSYGGYAALYATVATPKLFRCAVDVSGPSNLISFINSVPAEWFNFRSMIVKRIGDPGTDAGMLASHSPFNRADQIKTPLLIVQGAQDPRVNPAETEQFVEKLRNNQIDVEYLYFSDEGHGLIIPENQMKFYAAAEKFLAKHLGGKYQEAGGEVVKK